MDMKDEEGPCLCMGPFRPCPDCCASSAAALAVALRCANAAAARCTRTCVASRAAFASWAVTNQGRFCMHQCNAHVVQHAQTQPGMNAVQVVLLLVHRNLLKHFEKTICTMCIA